MLFQQTSFCQTFVLKCFQAFFFIKNAPLTSMLSHYVNYYSIKGGAGILVATQAKYFKDTSYK